jgi:hypothetical protein
VPLVLVAVLLLLRVHGLQRRVREIDASSK